MQPAAAYSEGCGPRYLGTVDVEEEFSVGKV